MPKPAAPSPAMTTRPRGRSRDSGRSRTVGRSAARSLPSGCARGDQHVLLWIESHTGGSQDGKPRLVTIEFLPSRELTSPTQRPTGTPLGHQISRCPSQAVASPCRGPARPKSGERRSAVPGGAIPPAEAAFRRRASREPMHSFQARITAGSNSPPGADGSSGPPPWPATIPLRSACLERPIPTCSQMSNKMVVGAYASTVESGTRCSSLRPDLGKGRGIGWAVPLASIVRQHSSYWPAVAQ